MENELENAIEYICKLEEKLKEQQDKIDYLKELVERFENEKC